MIAGEHLGVTRTLLGITPRPYVEHMEFLAGVIVVVVIVTILGAFGSSSGSTAGTARPTPTRREPSPAAGRRVAPPTRTMTSRRRELERQRIGDEAFFDGVVFSHYFMGDDRGTPAAETYDGFDDDMDDGYFD